VEREEIIIEVNKLKQSKVGGGRIAVYVPDHVGANCRGYILRSRYVMEQKLGRILGPNECVHHKDKNKLNDDPDNLELKSRGGHTKHHWEDGTFSSIIDYEWIRELIEEGYGYKRISKITGYNVNSTQSACRKIRLGHF